MLAKRIIPCLDVKEGRVVKGIHFLGLKEVGDPVELAKKYDEQQADELVFLDISATNEGRKTMIEVVKQVAKTIFIPFTVGGGIQDIDDITNLLRAGADKVSINSAAVANPDLIRQGANKFGSQCIVVAIDAKKRENQEGWTVHTHGGKTDTGIDLLEWVDTATSLGAGEILLTSMDADGTKDGFDIEMLRAVHDRVKIPVIASGGCGNVNHIVEVLKEDVAEAALAASIFHYDEYTVTDVKDVLYQQNIPVRR